MKGFLVILLLATLIAYLGAIPVPDDAAAPVTTPTTPAAPTAPASAVSTPAAPAATPPTSPVTTPKPVEQLISGAKNIMEGGMRFGMSMFG